VIVTKSNSPMAAEAEVRNFKGKGEIDTSLSNTLRGTKSGKCATVVFKTSRGCNPKRKQTNR
jgi:hypothetical protein